MQTICNHFSLNISTTHDAKVIKVEQEDAHVFKDAPDHVLRALSSNPYVTILIAIITILGIMHSKRMIDEFQRVAARRPVDDADVHDNIRAVYAILQRPRSSGGRLLSLVVTSQLPSRPL